jgi:hypothetical protein
MWWFVFYSRCTGIISRYTPTPSCERAGKGIVKSALVCRRIYICLDLSKTLYFCYANRFVCFSCWVLELLWIDRIYVKNVNGVDWVRPIFLKKWSWNGLLDPGSLKWLVEERLVILDNVGRRDKEHGRRKEYGGRKGKCVLVLLSPSRIRLDVVVLLSRRQLRHFCLFLIIPRIDRVGSATHPHRPNKRIQNWHYSADIWSKRLFAYDLA